MHPSTKIREALQAKRAEAQEAWGAFEEAQKAIQKDDFDPSKDKEAFEKAHELNKVYSTKEAEALTLEGQYGEALEMEGKTAPKQEGPFDTERKGYGGDFSLEFDGKTPGERVVESKSYKELVEAGVLGVESSKFAMAPAKALTREEHILAMKAGIDPVMMKTLATSFGAPGQQLLRNDRQPGFLALLRKPLNLRNLISVGATDGNTVEWVRMSAVTNNAAETAEATATGGSSGTKPESGFAFVVENTPVKTIAHFIPSTRAALSDMAQLRTIIDSILIDGVERRLNDQILNGDGTGANLKGILATSGIQSYPLTGGEPSVEAILKGITLCRLAFHEPSAIMLHPNDWQQIRLMRDGSGGAGTGQYLFGPPSQAGDSTLWGLPVIQDVTIAEGNGLVADWSQAILYVREGVVVLATDSHSDWFVRNMIAVLAEGRYALAVPRPAAFVEVTGI